MSLLEIDTATPFFNVLEKNNKPAIYTEDIVQSPLFTDTESRRSSYSSTSSEEKHKSLPCHKYELLYPTKKSAYDRIEYLEEKLKYQKDMNATVIQQMNQSIDDFLTLRKPIEYMDVVQPIYDLDFFLEFIHCIFHTKKMVEFIESNRFSVTDDKLTKQEFKNVVIQTIETEKDQFVQSCNQDMEQVMNDMQREMEVMIHEIDELRQIHDPTHLVKENKELSSRLVKAEHTAAQHLQKLQENNELEKVLQRTVAQKDAEAASITHKLQKLQQQYRRLQDGHEKRLQQDIKARFEDLESSLKSKYQKERDVFELQRTRDARALAGHITELEGEIENAERQHEQDQQMLAHIKKQYQSLSSQIEMKERQWDKKEEELKQMVLTYEQKLISLEKEVLVLYTKNIELVESLGKLD